MEARHVLASMLPPRQDPAQLMDAPHRVFQPEQIKHEGTDDGSTTGGNWYDMTHETALEEVGGDDAVEMFLEICDAMEEMEVSHEYNPHVVRLKKEVEL